MRSKKHLAIFFCFLMSRSDLSLSVVLLICDGFGERLISKQVSVF